MLGYLSRFVCTTLGFIYPSYLTFKAIKYNKPEQLAYWMKYWVVMGFFMLFECTLEWFISWIPFYYLIKITTVLFLTMPQTQGANVVYETYIGPLLTKYEVQIDKGIADFAKNAKRVGLNYFSLALQKIPQLFLGSNASVSGSAASANLNGLNFQKLGQMASVLSSSGGQTTDTSGASTAQLFSLASGLIGSYGSKGAASSSATGSRSVSATDSPIKGYDFEEIGKEDFSAGVSSATTPVQGQRRSSWKFWSGNEESPSAPAASVSASNISASPAAASAASASPQK